MIKIILIFTWIHEEGVWTSQQKQVTYFLFLQILSSKVVCVKKYFFLNIQHLYLTRSVSKTIQCKKKYNFWHICVALLFALFEMVVLVLLQCYLTKCARVTNITHCITSHSWQCSILQQSLLANINSVCFTSPWLQWSLNSKAKSLADRHF